MGCSASTQNPAGSPTGSGGKRRSGGGKLKNGANGKTGADGNGGVGSNSSDASPNGLFPSASATPTQIGPTAFPTSSSAIGEVLVDDDQLSSISSHSITRSNTPSENTPLRGGALGLGHRNSSDLSAAREAAIPSIEEELFVYDDFIVNKSAEWMKKARVAGRRPTKLPRSRPGDKEKFFFGDFSVTIVDEVDDLETAPLVPASGGSGGSEMAQHLRDLASRRSFSQHVPYVPYTGIRRFEVRNLLGHASRVKCIAIAPSENEYVSCSNEDASMTLFGFKTGKEMGIFTGHQDTVINATFSSDGKYLATTSRDHTMILWDVVTAKQILTFDHSKVVICCCFSRDSKYIATGCQDKICRLWETKRGRECLIFAQHDGIIISMSYAPDSTHIVSASADRTLRVWSTTTGKTRYTLQGHSGIVLSCQYTSDGKKIISNDEKLLKVWNTADGSCVLTLFVDDVNNRLKGSGVSTKKLTWTLSCVAPGEFTQYFFVACNNRFVYLLDIETGEEVASVFCKAPVYCLTPGFHNLAAFGDSFGNVYVVRIE